MKKVLVVTYYWPPSGGSGVQRWLHLTNHLPEYGWIPIVYAPEGAAYLEKDPGLKEKIKPTTCVLRKNIVEPNLFFLKYLRVKKGKIISTGMTLEENVNFFQKITNYLSIWIRGNLFIPDARMFWIKPSVRFLKKYLRTERIDAIITTGPPHSMHLIGYNLSRKTHIPWIADFRDPWTNIDFYSDLKLTLLADKYHHHLEKKVLRQADHVITVGEQIKKEFMGKGVKNISVVTNGYDEDDLPVKQPELDSKFSLLHTGTFTRSRNSEALWKSLKEIINKESGFANDLEIRLVGKTDHSVMQSIKKYSLKPYLKYTEYVPHQDALQMIHSAQVLLLMINNTANAKGILTGKFFEYLASGRPILLIGPTDGDAAKILYETSAGSASDFEDQEAIKNIIMNYYRLFKKQSLHSASKGVEKYSRRKLTGKLSKILENLA